MRFLGALLALLRSGSALSWCAPRWAYCRVFAHGSARFSFGFSLSAQRARQEATERVKRNATKVLVHSVGMYSLREPSGPALEAAFN
jgi:hypothetical protein